MRDISNGTSSFIMLKHRRKNILMIWRFLELVWL